MNKTDIKKIDQAGHVVGIHSHSHPTTLKKLSENLQYREYKDSKVILESLLRKKFGVCLTHVGVIIIPL